MREGKPQEFCVNALVDAHFAVATCKVPRAVNKQNARQKQDNERNAGKGAKYSKTLAVKFFALLKHAVIFDIDNNYAYVVIAACLQRSRYKVVGAVLRVSTRYRKSFYLRIFNHRRKTV